ncbi:Dihydrofolate synthase @ Folylpolyglutamate synthase, partial [hydrothermal vent metagenome]
LHDVYTDLQLNLHGRHQTAHLATAVASVEAFLDRPLPGDLIVPAVESVRSPGRSEVVLHEPLVLIDGAHNDEGLNGLVTTMSQEFPAISAWTLVIGVRGDRDPEHMIRVLGDQIVRVVVCAPDDPQALGVDVVADAAMRVVGADNVVVAQVVADAIKVAVQGADAGEGVVIAGSLYVAGEARSALGLA